MPRPILATIHADALRHNLGRIRQAAPDATTPTAADATQTHEAAEEEPKVVAAPAPAAEREPQPQRQEQTTATTAANAPEGKGITRRARPKAPAKKKGQRKGKRS
jgi:hypothetical protein